MKFVLFQVDIILTFVVLYFPLCDTCYGEKMKMEYGFENLIVSIISLLFVFTGGCFALWQYHKSISYKRIEIVKDLIKNTRENQQISTIMDMVDWNEGFGYNGVFYIDQGTTRKELKTTTNEELFRMIDYTLSVFSYICYLRRMDTITKKEMVFFEYGIRRLVDNIHIRNYLYSLYHWSKSINVNLSFSYLVEYCLKEKLLKDEFKIYSKTGKYCICYLQIN